MSKKETTSGLESNARRVLVLQGILMAILVFIVIVSGLLLLDSEKEADLLFDWVKAAVFGSVLGIIGTLLSARSVKKSSAAAIKMPQFAMLPIYAGLLSKMMVVGGGIAFGLVVLHLNPLCLIAGFMMVQIAFVWVAVSPKN